MDGTELPQSVVVLIQRIIANVTLNIPSCLYILQGSYQSPSTNLFVTFNETNYTAACFDNWVAIFRALKHIELKLQLQSIFLWLSVPPPTYVHNKIQFVHVLKTATCFGNEVPSTGNYKFKGAEAQHIKLGSNYNINVYNIICHTQLYILLDYIRLQFSYVFRPNCRAIFRLIFEQVECTVS